MASATNGTQDQSQRAERFSVRHLISRWDTIPYLELGKFNWRRRHSMRQEHSRAKYSQHQIDQMHASCGSYATRDQDPLDSVIPDCTASMIYSQGHCCNHYEHLHVGGTCTWEMQSIKLDRSHVSHQVPASQRLTIFSTHQIFQSLRPGIHKQHGRSDEHYSIPFEIATPTIPRCCWHLVGEDTVHKNRSQFSESSSRLALASTIRLLV
jgi:hypothetical protein